MSLKAFHIFFILVSVVLALGFGFWGIRDYQASQNLLNLFLGIASLAGGGALIIYLFWFLGKMRKIHVLVFLALLLSSSQVSWACSVCFGDPTSPMTKSTKLAVLFLLGVVSSVLGGIATVAIVWIRRAQKIASNSKLFLELR